MYSMSILILSVFLLFTVLNLNLVNSSTVKPKTDHIDIQLQHNTPGLDDNGKSIKFLRNFQASNPKLIRTHSDSGPYWELAGRKASPPPPPPLPAVPQWQRVGRPVFGPPWSHLFSGLMQEFRNPTVLQRLNRVEGSASPGDKFGTFRGWKKTKATELPTEQLVDWEHWPDMRKHHDKNDNSDDNNNNDDSDEKDNNKEIFMDFEIIFPPVGNGYRESVRSSKKQSFLDLLQHSLFPHTSRLHLDRVPFGHHHLHIGGVQRHIGGGLLSKPENGKDANAENSNGAGFVVDLEPHFPMHHRKHEGWQLIRQKQQIKHNGKQKQPPQQLQLSDDMIQHKEQQQEKQLKQQKQESQQQQQQSPPRSHKQQQSKEQGYQIPQDIKKSGVTLKYFNDLPGNKQKLEIHELLPTRIRDNERLQNPVKDFEQLKKEKTANNDDADKTKNPTSNLTKLANTSFDDSQTNHALPIFQIIDKYQDINNRNLSKSTRSKLLKGEMPTISVENNHGTGLYKNKLDLSYYPLPGIVPTSKNINKKNGQATVEGKVTNGNAKRFYNEQNIVPQSAHDISNKDKVSNSESTDSSDDKLLKLLRRNRRGAINTTQGGDPGSNHVIDFSKSPPKYSVNKSLHHSTNKQPAEFRRHPSKAKEMAANKMNRENIDHKSPGHDDRLEKMIAKDNSERVTGDQKNNLKMKQENKVKLEGKGTDFVDDMKDNVDKGKHRKWFGVIAFDDPRDTNVNSTKQDIKANRPSLHIRKKGAVGFVILGFSILILMVVACTVGLASAPSPGMRRATSRTALYSPNPYYDERNNHRTNLSFMES